MDGQRTLHLTINFCGVFRKVTSVGQLIIWFTANLISTGCWIIGFKLFVSPKTTYDREQILLSFKLFLCRSSSYLWWFHLLQNTKLIILLSIKEFFVLAQLLQHCPSGPKWTFCYQNNKENTMKIFSTKTIALKFTISNFEQNYHVIKIGLSLEWHNFTKEKVVTSF